MFLPRLSRLAVAIPFVAAGLSGSPIDLRAQGAPSVDSLAWLAGSWAASDRGVDHEEHWMAPKGGAMVGMHRTVRGGRMVEFEFLRIEAKDGALVYLSMPNGRSPATPFTLKALDGQRVTFENPTHDFPQRVIYRREGETLHARIEGTENGKPGSMEWSWRRSSLTQ
jgi:hypothetical protein